MCKGKCTGISFIDSTPISSCHIKKEKQHKTFKGIAQKGQCSIDWFYGFKLNLIINDKGELLDFILTLGNVDNRIMLRKKALIESVNDELKNMCQLEHTRHRNFDNFIINTLSALAAYSFFDKKSWINTIDDIVEKDKLAVT